ncbi:hypothetical protein J437_LFUL010996, partial [Ladona fulva]
MEFREEILDALLKSEDREDLNEGNRQPEPSRLWKRSYMSSHSFMRIEGSSQYCRGCYERKKTGEISKNVLKKVTTYCNDCTEKPNI